MAYLIQTLDGVTIDGGQTRNQVIRALQQHGFASMPLRDKIPAMPKHGRVLILANPLPLPSCRIVAV